jgi:hypothetical protein
VVEAFFILLTKAIRKGFLMMPYYYNFRRIGFAAALHVPTAIPWIPTHALRSFSIPELIFVFSHFWYGSRIELLTQNIEYAR